ncbi:MAG: AAA family ATPase [Peptococcaceae bacterium]|nr:AAA family ATPase [Peptococcaceae bacterium]
MPRVIAIANQKGGVAKTTTAINLSASLAEAGCQVLLVDMDPQGNATSGLGIEKNRLNDCIYDVFMNGVPLAEVIQQTTQENLQLIPARIELAGAEIELVGQPAREYRLKEVLDLFLKESGDGFDFVFIDCPPSLGLLTLNALTAATDVLIPVQCEYFALEGLTLLINTLERVRENLNPQLNILGAVLTMFDARTNLSIQVVEEVKAFFRLKIFQTIIPRNVRLGEAPSHGKSVLLYDSRSRGAEVYRELAMEVLERVV